MTMTMYSIKDELNGFATPIPMMSEEIAKRYFKDMYEGNPTVKNSPEDFSLWYVGDFDTETAQLIIPTAGAKLIERAQNYGR